MLGAALLVIAGLGVATTLLVTRSHTGPSCASAGAPVTEIWEPSTRDTVRRAFVATKIAYAPAAADRMIEQLDGWSARWQLEANATCKATIIDRVQPAATDALRRDCLGGLLGQLRPVVALAQSPDSQVIANASSLIGSLPEPARCADIAGLSALPPLPAAESAQLQSSRSAGDRRRRGRADRGPRERDPSGRAGTARARKRDRLPTASRACRAARRPARARVGALRGRHRGAPRGGAAATAARDLKLLAKLWIELSQALGNDIRTHVKAKLFDGYGAALIGSSRVDRRKLQLELRAATTTSPVPTTPPLLQPHAST